MMLGIFPDQFKEALIVPLLKKLGLELIEKNYRPVSNLQFISKLCERAAGNQLVGHVKGGGLYEVVQSAYRDGHSTETALLKVQNDILNAMDNQQVTLLVLLDLSAAFDTVDHTILLKRLEVMYGISGTALKWFESYLTKRTQVVNINGTKSEKEELKWGVPQGSVLGPILFTLYTKPLGDLIRKHGVTPHFYADDSQIYVSMKPTQPDIDLTFAQIEACIEEVRNWMLENKLKLNDDKTVFMIIGNPTQSKKVERNSIKIGEIDIEKNSSTKNLGSVWDSAMKMDEHVKSICKSGYYQLRVIASLRKFLDQKATESLVHAFITSRLDYCNSLLAVCADYQIEKLQSLQNSAARVITKTRKFDHITPVLKDLHWLPISKRITFKQLLLVFKCLNDKGPQYLSDLLKWQNKPTSLRSSKKSNTLVVPKVTCVTFGGRSFQYLGPEMWNELPESMRRMDKVDTFKQHLKTHLFQMYYS